MPKHKNPFPPIEKKISLPPMLVGEVEAELFSDLEGKVPYGAWSKLVQGLLQERKLLVERRAALRAKLEALVEPSNGDPEQAHSEADSLLVQELTALGYDMEPFSRIRRWFA
jgi:hypothetical protein